ncbi:MAG: hypothetical protein NVSMB45_02180 [Ginsengibacter sp.]
MVTHPFKEISHIKEMMDRSSNFKCISGVGGVASGMIAILTMLVYFTSSRKAFYTQLVSFDQFEFANQIERIVVLAVSCFELAFSISFYFIWKRSNRMGISVFSSLSKRVFINIAVPMCVGGLLMIKVCMLHYYDLVIPVCLLFYGMGLMGAARSTFKEVYYLAAGFLLLGCVSLFLPGYAFLYWTIGFGILHIIFGFFLWKRYEKN